MLKVFLGLISMTILSCSFKQPEKDTLYNRLNSFKERGITADMCSFCSIDSFLVATVDRDIETKIIINYPVAIELLDRVELMNKYNTEAGYDTLMKLFKMRHWGDRNEIYRLTDLLGYYNQGIKPVLVDNSVIIIDSIKHERYVTIKDGDINYIIDLNRYRVDDGVLMFNPGKEPIYWTMEKDWENCYEYYGFPKWYFNCH